MKSIFDTGEILIADGGCILKNPSDIGITWGYCLINKDDELIREDSGFLALKGGTNNLAELLAAIKGLESLPAGWCGSFCSDSQITLGRLFQSWKMKNIPQEYIIRAHNALERLGNIEPIHVRGHQTKKQLNEQGNQFGKWNTRVDLLCNEAKKLANS